MDIKESMKTEKEKFKAMSWRDRLWYIKSYYKFHIAAALFLILALVTVGQIMYRKTFTTRLYISIINDRTQEGYTDCLDAILKSQIDYGPKDVLEIDSSMRMTFDETKMTQLDYASLAKMGALIASNTIDIMIADEEIINHYASGGGFLDLSQEFPEFSAASDNASAITAVLEDGSSCLAALSLENSLLAQESGQDLSGIYIAVMSNAPHTEEALNSLKLLLP